MKNKTTFILSNIVPQSPTLNRQKWKAFEDYTRSLLPTGHECYTIAGTYATTGIGDQGTVNTLANGHLSVPAALWKVIVVLPMGPDDTKRINAQTQIIAVWIPNRNSAGENPWKNYQTSVDQIETKTGFNLLSNIPQDIQKTIESSVNQTVIQ